MQIAPLAAGRHAVRRVPRERRAGAGLNPL